MRETRTWHDDSGRKIGEAEFENGKSHGVTRHWSRDGVLTLEAHMAFGEYHGNYASWWNSGNRKEEGRYYRGRRVGLYRWYSQNGMLLKEEDYGPGVL